MADNKSRTDRALEEQRRYIAQREKGYREQALKLYPWICGRCAREFTRANLSELTVHHVNHNHDDNPADGSNWELLCLYCHDEEHSKFENFVRYGGSSESRTRAATHNPFAGLKDALGMKTRTIEEQAGEDPAGRGTDESKDALAG